MSLRTRLALFIAVAVAVALLLQGVSGYLVFRQQAYASLDNDLRLYLTQVRRALPRNQGPRRGDFGFLPRDYLAKVRFIRDGEVIAAQDDFPEGIPLELGERPRTYGIWRVGSQTEDLPGRVGVDPLDVQVALSSRDLLRSLERYRRTLAFTVLSVSALGALLAFWLSRPALRPLEHLLSVAQRVATSGNLSLRVPTGGGGELGTLSETFNRMLSRLAAFRARESDFTRSASHELRTPLASMTLHLSSYREGYADAEETVAVLEEEVGRMTHLTEALLTLAREGRTQQIGVDAAGLARETAERAGVVYQGPASLTLSGDPILLRQALSNLIENAQKHAPGTKVIELKASVDEAQPYALLSVSDAGPGMSSEEMRRASEAFYRAPGTRTKGSGLGLTVVAQVAQVHGGRLELSPNHPSGLRATMWLRLAEQDEPHQSRTPRLST